MLGLERRFIFRGPRGLYYSKGEERSYRTLHMARLSATAEVAVLRAARMGAAQVEFPSDLAIGAREQEQEARRGLRRSSVKKAEMDVSSP